LAGLGILLYTDEMIPWELARQLQRLGYDVLSCEAAGRSNQRISDENQLAYATQQDRAILTFNRDDFLALDRQWKAAGRSHAGIIVSVPISNIGHLLRCVARHLDTYTPETQKNVLLWLDTSPVQ
jgi:predicted nuclease of predicted toxin-antitoxin system